MLRICMPWECRRGRGLWFDQADVLDYEVLVHVDRVLDYVPLPGSPSDRSYHSSTSGLPEDELKEEWPVCRRFIWKLGVPDPDDADRWAPMHRRVSAFERLDDRGRDRSPPPPGGGGPRLFHGLLQMPPSGPHDLPFLRGGHGGGGAGHSGGGGGQRYQRREQQ
jgi:hypothetical protein